jgi:sulfur carrier protein ThiS
MLTALLITALVLVGCGGREEEPEPEPQAKIPLLMPRFTVSLNDAGVPSILGISLESVGRLLRQDVSGLKVDPATVQMLKDAGIQNFEAVATAEGLYLYVNGQPVPYLALDEETRANVGNLLKLAGVQDGTSNLVQNLLNNNILSRVGVPVVIKLPVAAGASEAELRDSKTLPRVDTDEARASVDEKVLILHLDVALDEQGVPTIAGTSMTDFQGALNEAGLAADLSSVKVDPATIASLQAANVLLLQVETEPEGLYLNVNGQRLPRVAWDDERLRNALELYSSLEPDSPYLPLLQFFLPFIQPADVELGVTLPVPAGQEAPAAAPWVTD